jgi:hypothetical protein
MHGVFLVSDSTMPDPLGGKNLEQCIGLLQKPGCGTEPVLSGDRGGTMQIATFGVLIAALAVIALRIGRAVVSRDKIRNAAATPATDTSPRD